MSDENGKGTGGTVIGFVVAGCVALGLMALFRLFARWLGF